MAEPLAKSNPRQTLRHHTDEVIRAVESMTHAIAPYLSPSMARELSIAAYLHDTGKVAIGFQKQLTDNQKWGQRHEILSAAIAMWLGFSDETVLAVLTHHRNLDNDVMLAVGRNSSNYAWSKHGVVQWRNLLQELSDNWQWLQDFLKVLGHLPEQPRDLPDLLTLFEKYMPENIDGLENPQTRNILLMRGLLMAADHLASGYQKQLQPLSSPQWTVNWRPFQNALGKQKGHVFLEAPTGSGKTEAALKWALNNRQAQERIFYVLPTQASINAMTDRLRKIFGSEQVAPLHHRVLQQEFQNYFDEESDYIQAANAARKQADLYRQFYSPIKVLTPFQIIKHLFGSRFFEIGLSEMAGATIIFDEIHAYDARVQALIEGSIRYLNEHFHTKICFMSATFPSFLKHRLFDTAPNGTLIQLSSEKEGFELFQPRHHLVIHHATLENMQEDILSDIESGKRVLIICNRVDQAQSLFGLLSDKVPESMLLHSRFIQRDRQRIERNLLEKEQSIKLLVATQVVEVSLDISFDTCYTEIAPVDDLLQRFGRVNRRREHSKPVIVNVCMLYDESRVKYIYSPERLQATLQYAPNGKDLTRTNELEWIEKVYANGFLPKEQKIYDETKNSLQIVLKALKPLYTSNHQIDFDNLFDSIEVVPELFKSDYLTLIEEKQYLRAQELLVSLRYGSLNSLKKTNLVVILEDKPVVQCKYDAKLGLLFHQTEVESQFITD